MCVTLMTKPKNVFIPIVILAYIPVAYLICALGPNICYYQSIKILNISFFTLIYKSYCSVYIALNIYLKFMILQNSFWDYFIWEAFCCGYFKTDCLWLSCCKLHLDFQGNFKQRCQVVPEIILDSLPVSFVQYSHNLCVCWAIRWYSNWQFIQ